MERASWFQFGLVGADASGGGLMERASCNSFPHWLPWCFTRGFMEWGIHLNCSSVVSWGDSWNARYTSSSAGSALLLQEGVS